MHGSTSRTPGTRRRGDALLRAIYQAVLVELAENGFRGLTMDRIAARAETGRMPLYRRWKSPEDLVLAAIADALTDIGEPVDTGSLRGDVLALFRRMTRRILVDPLGPALASIIGERRRHPELVDTIRDRIIRPHLDAITAAVHRSAERGEIEATAITPEICAAGPALILVNNLINGTPPADSELTAIVDNLVLPSLGARRHGTPAPESGHT